MHLDNERTARTHGTMPPSFSRFRTHEAAPKRPRSSFTRKPLQPKVFVPANSPALPHPIDIPPDIFPFPVAEDLVPAIALPADPHVEAHHVHADTVSQIATLANGHRLAVERATVDAVHSFAHEDMTHVTSFVPIQKADTVVRVVPEQFHQPHELQEYTMQQQQQQQQQQDQQQQQLRQPGNPIRKERRRASGILRHASRASWLLYEDRLLTTLTRRYPDDWELISAHFSDRTAAQLQRRWQDHLKLSRKWTREEGTTIRKLNLRHPGDWQRISSALKSRSPASIRYHWFYDLCHDPEYA